MLSTFSSSWDVSKMKKMNWNQQQALRKIKLEALNSSNYKVCDMHQLCSKTFNTTTTWGIFPTILFNSFQSSWSWQTSLLTQLEFCSRQKLLTKENNNEKTEKKVGKMTLKLNRHCFVYTFFVSFCMVSQWAPINAQNWLYNYDSLAATAV